MARFPVTLNDRQKRRRLGPDGGGVEFFQAVDGWRLRYGYWQTTTRCRGTVFVLPGRTEFIEKYFEVTADLLKRGFNVLVLDWRGQGLSGRTLKEEPEKNHITDFSLLGRDLKELLILAGRKRIPKPWYALGHSTGALCFMQYLADTPSGDAKFEKAVFTSPLFGLRFWLLGEAQVRRMVKNAFAKGREKDFVPGHGKYGWKAKSFLTRGRLTSDKDRFSDTAWFFDENPALAIGGVTYGWLGAALKTTSMIQQSDLARKIRIPMLFVLAGQERVVDSGSAEAFIARIPTASMVKLQDARHEILMERDEIRDTFWKLFDNFIP